MTFPCGRLRLAISTLVVGVITLSSGSACDRATPDGKVAYQLPGLPIEFDIGFDGKVSVMLTDSITTPFGRFSIKMGESIKPTKDDETRAKADTVLVIEHIVDGERWVDKFQSTGQGGFAVCRDGILYQRVPKDEHWVLIPALDSTSQVRLIRAEQADQCKAPLPTPPSTKPAPSPQPSTSQSSDSAEGQSSRSSGPGSPSPSHDRPSPTENPTTADCSSPIWGEQGAPPSPCDAPDARPVPAGARRLGKVNLGTVCASGTSAHMRWPVTWGWRCGVGSGHGYVDGDASLSVDEACVLRYGSAALSSFTDYNVPDSWFCFIS